MNGASRIARLASVFGPVGAVGGFISDVLQPLAPFSKYVFLVSASLTVMLVLGVFIFRSLRPRLAPPLVMAASFLIFSGILLSLQTQEAEAKGVLASNISAVEKLQASLGLIQKDIAEIKETTKEIAKSTGKIAATLDAMQQSFASLTKSGGIIENPSSAEEYYHNARLYEQRGDYLNARRSYSQFFAFKLDVLDPHLRYQTFLTVQEGKAGAREIYTSFYENDKRPLIEFARLILFDAPTRTEMLKAFIAANPDFAPAYYELSRDFSALRKGTPSLSDKSEELAALERFKTLADEGKFVKWFIDKEVAAKWLEDASARLASLAVWKQSAGGVPVTLSAMRSNSDWTATLSFREIPREVFWRLEGEDAFRSTGFAEAINPATGLKMPNTYVMLKPSTPKTKVIVKYLDVGNEMRGPYELEFDPAQALFDSQKKMLSLTKNSWIAFRDFNGKLLVYFTQLASMRCAVADVAYGIDQDAMPSNFPLSECDAKDPYSVGEGKLLIEAPLNTKYITVQLTYKDGSKSDAVRFER